MIPLYSVEETEYRRRAARRARTAAILISVCGAAVCTLLCFFVRTANAVPLQWTVIAVSAFCGWTAILLRRFVILPALRESSHAEGLLNGPSAEEHAGILLRSDPPFRIPKSIILRNIVLLEGGKEITLKINENRFALLPQAGSRVRLQTVRGYITGIGGPQETGAQHSGSAAGNGKTVRHRLSAASAGMIPALILWLMISVFFWSWIFTFLTDTVPEKKIALYADVPSVNETALASQLEEAGLPGIRMIKVHAFSHAMFDGEPLRNADIYLIPLSEAETYREWYAPLPAELTAADCLSLDGIAFGIPALRADGCLPAASVICYSDVPGVSPEPYYLFFGNRSVHLPGTENTADNPAVRTVRKLLDLN